MNPEIERKWHTYDDGENETRWSAGKKPIEPATLADPIPTPPLPQETVQDDKSNGDKA